MPHPNPAHSNPHPDPNRSPTSPLGARTAPGIATEQGAAAPHDDRRGSCNDWSTYSSNIAQHGTTGKAASSTSRGYYYPSAGSIHGDQFKVANSNTPTWSNIPLVAGRDNAESVTQQSGCIGTDCQAPAPTLGGSSLPMSARGACGTTYPIYSHLSQSDPSFWQNAAAKQYN